MLGLKKWLFFQVVNKNTVDYKMDILIESSSFGYITAAHAFVKALDRSTVQFFNGSTPRSMDAQLSIALQFKSSMDQRQGQWTHSSRSTVQQRQGGTQISRNGRKISIPDNNKHEQETFRSQVHTLDFDWTARQLCMSCT